jgi:hypothetical protein
MYATGAGSRSEFRRARFVPSLTLLLCITLSACRTPPSFAILTPYGTVRAVDEPTARFFAVALERESGRLERLSPRRPSPPLEVWVSTGPLDAAGRERAARTFLPALDDPSRPR